MTTQQVRTINNINAKDEARRFIADQAAIEGAALRGELGIDAQLVAMSEQYKALKLAGELEAAAAVKALAVRLYEGGK